MIDLELLEEEKPVELELEQNSKGGTKNYNELDNKPKINGKELKGNLSLEDLGIIVNAVKDILVNGATIVDKNGNAIIPVATSKNLGLVGIESQQGINAHASGKIYVNKAENDEIDARANSYKPIVPKNLPYAVKSAMSSVTDEEWTQEEKANARKRMGMEWRYIGKIETTEDVARMEMALDENGQPFNLRKVRVKVVNYPNASNLNTSIRLCFNNKTADIFHDSTMMSGVKTTETTKRCEVIVEKICNHLFPISVYSSLNNGSASMVMNSNGTTSYNNDCCEIDGYINQIYLYSWQNVIGKGAYMEVWGVDA